MVMTVGRGMKSARASFPGEKFTGVSHVYRQGAIVPLWWNLNTKRFSVLLINKFDGRVLEALAFSSQTISR